MLKQIFLYTIFATLYNYRMIFLRKILKPGIYVNKVRNISIKTPLKILLTAQNSSKTLDVYFLTFCNIPY